MSHEELLELSLFMSGPSGPSARRIIVFFSVKGKPVRPREAKEFWESLSEDEQYDYWAQLFRACE